MDELLEEGVELLLTAVERVVSGLFEGLVRVRSVLVTVVLVALEVVVFLLVVAFVERLTVVLLSCVPSLVAATRDVVLFEASER